MAREKKEQIVQQLSEMLAESEIIIATDYRGLRVSELSELRQQLRDSGIRYRVVKNTLATFAAANAGRPQLTQLLAGPTALAFGHDDAVQLAKILADYQKTAATPLKIKGALLGSRVLSPQEIAALAALPPRQVLTARLMGTLQGPVAALHNVLAANLRNLVWILQAKIQQMEA